MEHTPTPWRGVSVNDSGQHGVVTAVVIKSINHKNIGYVDSSADDAKAIIVCVNNHARLVEALTDAVSMARSEWGSAPMLWTDALAAAESNAQ